MVRFERLLIILAACCMGPQLVTSWSLFGSDNIPKPEIGGRVVDLLNGEHFDDILKDTPDPLRPAGLVLFYRSKDAACAKAYEAMNYRRHAENDLPGRERIFIAKYDMDLHDKRLKTAFSPEQDLPTRVGVSQCPSLVYVPRKCNGHTEWCTEKIGDGIESVGCEDFKDQCTGWRVWDGNGDAMDWAREQIDSEEWPALDKNFGSWGRQTDWIKGRERVTTNTHMRNNFLAPNLPKFSPTGTKLMKMPEQLNRELLDFYHKNVERRSNEPWDIYGATQLNFHEIGTDLVYLDLDPYFRDRIANNIIRPILEEWSGQKLKLNAFYGMREYFPGAWLRNHVDRIDTHVISATISLLKINSSEPWPLETVDWSGKRMRYEHRAGEMLLYESSTRPHGRPYRMNDGIHVGCFVHFSPLNESTFKPHLSEGRRKLQNSITQVHWSSAKSSGPTHPEETREVEVIVTPENMDRKNRDSRKKATSSSKSNRHSRGQRAAAAGSLKVDFVNDSEHGLALYWVDFNGVAMRNAFMDAGQTVMINTYEDHEFFFAPAGVEKPSPSEYRTVKIGKGTNEVKATELLGSMQKVHTGL